MAATFPMNPIFGQKYTYGANTYIYDGNGWVYKPDLYLNGLNIRDKITFENAIVFDKNIFRYYTEVSQSKTIEVIKPLDLNIFEFEIEIKVFDAILVSFSSDFVKTDNYIISARGIHLMQCIYDHGVVYIKNKMTYPIPIVFLNYNVISTGQYLDTGVVMDGSPVKFEISCKLGNSNNDNIFGARTTGGTLRFSLSKDATLSNANFYHGALNTIQLNENVSANDVYRYDGTLLHINNESYSVSFSSINSGVSLSLFGMNTGGSISSILGVVKKISYFKLYKNDILVCDYVAIPNGFEYTTGMYATQNGFYDKITQTVKYGNTPFQIETI